MYATTLKGEWFCFACGDEAHRPANTLTESSGVVDASVDEGTSSAVLFERVRERGAQRVAVENELGERRHVAKLGRERGQPAERVGERCESKEVTPTRYRRR